MNALRTRFSKMHRQSGGEAFHLDVDTSFRPGITAIFGASGSGKSTWLECIAGLQRPGSGEIALGGIKFFDSANQVDIVPARRGIGYIFQNAALFPHMSVRANLEYGIHALAAAERRSVAEQALEAFRIADLAEKNAGTISGGERQRVALARALVRNPGCLLLDEPFSALDVETKLRIMDDVVRWNRERDIPIVLVTHALEEVFAMANRVVVLAQGRVTGGGDPHGVLGAQRDLLLARLSSSAERRDLLS